MLPFFDGDHDLPGFIVLPCAPLGCLTLLAFLGSLLAQPVVSLAVLSTPLVVASALVSAPVVVARRSASARCRSFFACHKVTPIARKVAPARTRVPIAVQSTAVRPECVTGGSYDREGRKVGNRAEDGASD
jgi:hypothetical protein